MTDPVSTTPATFTLTGSDISATVLALVRAARESEAEGLWSEGATEWRLASQMYRALGHDALAAHYARKAVALQDRIEAKSAA